MSLPTIPLLPSSPSRSLPPTPSTPPTTSLPTPPSPLHALRLLDLLDYHLYQHPSLTPSTPLSSPPPCITSDREWRNWYTAFCRKLAREKGVLTPPSVQDVRVQIVEEFVFDQSVLGRYNTGGDTTGNGGEYFQTMEWKRVLAYLEEVEKAREMVRWRDLAAVRERKVMEGLEEMWRGRVAEEEEKHQTQLREKTALIQHLETKITELETAVKGLTKMLCDQPPVTRMEVEKAVEEFEGEMELVKRRLVERVSKTTRDTTDVTTTTNTLLREAREARNSASSFTSSSHSHSSPNQHHHQQHHQQHRVYINPGSPTSPRQTRHITWSPSVSTERSRSSVASIPAEGSGSPGSAGSAVGNQGVVVVV
ncbi:hypothetical protein EX30DRAFT_396349, partial [Ascodesmis nigricans]